MSQKLNITKFNVAAIYSKDLKTSIDFYTNILGFEKLSYAGAGAQLSLKSKDNPLEIFLQGGYSKDNRNYESSKISLCFETSSINDTYQKVKDLNVPISFELKEIHTNYGMFCIKDPSGNQIMFTGNL